MKSARKETKASTNNATNVVPFQRGSESDRILRQEVIREHLMSLACQDGDKSAIASACALLQADGTVQLAAKGIDRDVAIQMADALDQLSDALRCHAKKPDQKRSGDRQRGFVNLSISISIGFVVAVFINQIAWVDAAMMVAAQLIAAHFPSRAPQNQISRDA